jgi:hypothetical protein
VAFIWFKRVMRTQVAQMHINEKSLQL